MTVSLVTGAMLNYMYHFVSELRQWEFRIVWSLVLCYVIFACANGRGGAVKWFLSLPLWHPLSRLSFVIFLIEQPVMRVLLKDGQHFSTIGFVRIFSMHIVSFLLS